MDGCLRAIANATRRTILAEVWNEEASAGSIAAKIDLAQASVSEHLKVLRKCGLVTVDKRGTSWFYRANHQAFVQLLLLLKTEFPTDSPNKK